MKDVYRHLFFGHCLYEIQKNDWVDVMKLWPPVTFPYTKFRRMIGCLYEIQKNDWVDVMKLWPPVTFPDVYGQY